MKHLCAMRATRSICAGGAGLFSYAFFAFFVAFYYGFFAKQPPAKWAPEERNA